jgi:hypothetical protein
VYIRGEYLAKRPFRLAAAVTRVTERPGFQTNRLAACAARNGEKFWIFVDENSE